jgi:hypothetical protein
MYAATDCPAWEVEILWLIEFFDCTGQANGADCMNAGLSLFAIENRCHGANWHELTLFYKMLF